MTNEATRNFIAAHAGEDVHRLALQSKVPDGVDLRAALVQIEGRQRLANKAPRFSSTPGVEFPERLPAEQCSGEATAAYKAATAKRLVAQRAAMADLTGGLGIDFMAMSPLFDKAAYVEHDEALCSLARNNFAATGIRNASITCSEAAEFLVGMGRTDFVFIDPARRDAANRKVVLLEDCTPDITAMLPLLKEKCRFVMIKLSPMLDISATIAKTGNCKEIHVVAVNGEVKEIAVFIDFSFSGEAEIVCSDISGGATESFIFRMSEEHATTCTFADETGIFLYEPDATILKAGAFRLPAQRFGLKKLHPNTHLYTSDVKNPDFIGKIFKIEGIFGFSKKELRRLGNTLACANVSVRNFPTPAEELQKRLRIKNGGENYIFGTTLHSGKHAIIYCRLIDRKNRRSLLD